MISYQDIAKKGIGSLLKDQQYGHAENIFSNGKLLVLEVKRTGIDINEMVDLLKKGKMALDREDYISSYAFSLEVVQKTQEHLRVRQEAYKAIKKFSTGSKEIREEEIISLSVGDIIDRARTAYGNHNYIEAKTIAENGLFFARLEHWASGFLDDDQMFIARKRCREILINYVNELEEKRNKYKIVQDIDVPSCFQLLTDAERVFEEKYFRDSDIEDENNGRGKV